MSQSSKVEKNVETWKVGKYRFVTDLKIFLVFVPGIAFTVGFLLHVMEPTTKW